MKKRSRSNTFTKAEFRAIGLTLMVVILGVILPPYVSGIVAGADPPSIAVRVITEEPKSADSIPPDTTRKIAEQKKPSNISSPPGRIEGFIDINTADSVQLKQLRGIGNVLSKRIVKFRDRLGGFYSIGQVGETYGLSPETFASIQNSIRILTPHQKLPLTEASVEAFARHPYISWDQARQLLKIVRNDKGEITSDELLTVGDSVWVKKVLPYFEVKQ